MKKLIIEATRGTDLDVIASCLSASGIQMVSDSMSASFKSLSDAKLKKELDRALKNYHVEFTIINLDDGMEEEVILQSDDWDE